MPLFTDNEKKVLVIVSIAIVLVTTYLLLYGIDWSEPTLNQLILGIENVSVSQLNSATNEIHLVADEIDYSIVLVGGNLNSSRGINWTAAALAFSLENLKKTIVVLESHRFTKELHLEIIDRFEQIKKNKRSSGRTIPEVVLYRDREFYRACDPDYRLNIETYFNSDLSPPKPIEVLPLKTYFIDERLLIPTLEYHLETAVTVLEETLNNSARMPDAVVLNLTSADPQLFSYHSFSTALAQLSANNIYIIVIGWPSGVHFSGDTLIQTSPLLTTEVASAKVNFLLSNSPRDLIQELFRVSFRGEPVLNTVHSHDRPDLSNVSQTDENRNQQHKTTGRSSRYRRG